jgi:hypothetical protein
LQTAEPLKTLFLKIFTSKSFVHTPVTTAGSVVKVAPLTGAEMVGDVVGGGELIVPCTPVPPLTGLSIARARVGMHISTTTEITIANRKEI